MSRSKKFMALLLAVVLVVQGGFTAFAAENTLNSTPAATVAEDTTEEAAESESTAAELTEENTDQKTEVTDQQTTEEKEVTEETTTETTEDTTAVEETKTEDTTSEVTTASEETTVSDGEAPAADKATEEQKTEEPVEEKAVDTLKASRLMVMPLDAGDEPVCKIGDTEYTVFDEAVKAASDGDTIVLLKDCKTEGLNLSKNLTVTGSDDKKQCLTFTKYGIALWGKTLTFQDCEVLMEGIGSTPYTAEWNWMTICASKDASLNLERATMTLDGSNAGNKHAIYFCSNNKLNLTDSVLTIKNYTQDALEWDGGDGGYNINITNSTFVSDHNRSGFTGTFVATITNSKVNVINSSGNGSNGSHFEIKEESVVNFNNNGSHGLSAGRLLIDNSTVNANENGANGIHAAGSLTIQNYAEVSIKGNGCTISSKWTLPGALYVGNDLKKNSVIDGTSTVTIQDNKGSGILLKAGSLKIGSKVLITRNEAVKLGYGGGVNNYSNGTLEIAESTQLYNNHAPLAGDDIYNEKDAKTIVGNVGADWSLDGDPDCTDAIDGWYDDSEGSRWEAHDADAYHIEKLQPRDYTISGQVSLKAAHGITVPDEPYTPNAPLEVETSKSKEATNLDENFESKVTLSLPSAESQIETDVVFVLDYSTCGDPVQEEALKMLETLNRQLEGKNAAVNVGAVIYRGEVTTYPLTKLTGESLESLKTFMGNVPETKGSNMHSGLLAAENMLAADTSVDDACKYMILVSDGIAYIWDEDGTNMGLNAEQVDGISTVFRASPDCWYIKYRTSEGPENWKDHFDSLDGKINIALELYKEKYDRSVDPVKYIPYSQRDVYASTVDVALYKSYVEYTTMESKYNCYAVEAGTESDRNAYPWGASFMNYLANGKSVSFEDIRNDIYYLLDEGSQVIDEIGETEDYNFDFVNDIKKLSLTVGGRELTAAVYTDGLEAGETAAYSFGERMDNQKYPFVLHYYKDGTVTEKGSFGECFIWDINVPVSKFEQVQLTYSVHLENPKTDAGTYGEYDQFGENKKDALYTNNSATLYPVDTNGNEGKTEVFEKPTVSYTVKSPDAGSADITITKKVQNSSGEDKKVTRTFYAAVFEDPEYKTMYGNVVELKLNKASEVYATVTVETPADGSDRSYYVVETDKDGKVVNGGKSFGYQITIKGSEAIVSKGNAEADVTIINKEIKTSSSKKHSSSSGDPETPSSVQAAVTSAQTGDTNNILVPVLMLLLAAVLLGSYGVITYRKKKGTGN